MHRGRNHLSTSTGNLDLHWASFLTVPHKCLCLCCTLTWNDPPPTPLNSTFSTSPGPTAHLLPCPRMDHFSCSNPLDVGLWFLSLWPAPDCLLEAHMERVSFRAPPLELTQQGLAGGLAVCEREVVLVLSFPPRKRRKCWLSLTYLPGLKSLGSWMVWFPFRGHWVGTNLWFTSRGHCTLSGCQVEAQPHCLYINSHKAPFSLYKEPPFSWEPRPSLWSGAEKQITAS